MMNRALAHQHRIERNHAMPKYTIEDAWNALIEAGISEETLQIVTAINGYTMDTLLDVLFASQGCRSFEQWLDD